MEFTFFNICLSDIPKDKIKQSKNGKCYIELVTMNLREVDEKGRTHNMAVALTEDERKAGVKTTYLGRGTRKIVSFDPSTEEVSEMPKASASVLDDLPF